MSQHSKESYFYLWTRQVLSFCMLLGCLCIAFTASAAALPKGNCIDPKPHTDLRHCKFQMADLRNKDLSGTDLRGVSLWGAKLQGANLTNAIYKRGWLLQANLDGAKGLPQEILDTLAVYKTVNNSYLVTPKGNSKITLTPHGAVEGIEENIAGLANIQMFKKIEKESQTIALLDWPRHMDGPMMSIIARFDNNKDAVPACYQPVSLIAEEGGGYYYPGWGGLEVRPLGNKAYLIGVVASGGDGYGEGMTGWEKIAILKLSSACTLTVLYEERVGWVEAYPGAEHKDCQGEHLDFEFADDQTAIIKTTQHTCSFSPKVKAKITTKKINLK